MLTARELKCGSRVELDGDAAGHLIEGLEGTRSVLFNGRCLSRALPQTAVLRVREADPRTRGATVLAQTEATLGTGEAVRADARDGRFVARASS